MNNRMQEQLSDVVAGRLKRGEKFNILDVREQEEWDSGHIPNATHIPLGQLEHRYSELNAAEEIVVVCRSGKRSEKACEILSAKGYNVINMIGGMSEWPGQVE
ncbi:MAG: rhodanese-like domain-containing protein [Candidatus Cohnella colombiensis]|uniref:Rhodanese-like domain-containing protein n=1 Tax=Candidatus Cohnella colombiensis TaxID=3121368 RepID=A0AA95JBJ9_9BACL|nr:MAG: rhodanese-like domain-containing protein [Cohnella sp.]